MTAYNQKNCHCAVFSAFWLSIAAAAPLEFFVSPSGSDSNPGTKERPFATLEKASAAVRERSADQKAIVTVRGGRYVFSKTWTLNGADSGTVGSPVIYRAFPEETVELTGFQDISLSTLKPVDSPEILNRLVDPRARAHLMELDLSEVDMALFGRISRKGYRLNRSSWPYNNDPNHVMGESPEVQLFIDGKRQVLARWPNQNEQVNPDWKVYPTVQLPGVVGYQEVLDRGPYEADADFFDRGGKIRVDYDRVKYWTQADDIWVEGCLTASWRLTRNKIKTLDPDRQTLEFAYGEVGEVGRDLRLDSRVNNKALVWSGPFFWYINLLEEIDVPGEYYIDYANKKLYFYPPEDMNFSRSRLSFPKLTGALVKLQNASQIVFDGLTLSGSLGSGIVVNGSDSVRIRNCEISDVSGTAIDLGNNQNRNCVIEHCHIHGIGSQGVFLGGGNAIQMIRGNNVVSDCEIHDIGFSKLCWSSAVSFSVGSVGNTLQHSRIYDLPHMGILFRGNENTIQYCEIYDFGKIFLDNGAIYGNSEGRMYEAGQKIYHNWFHTVPLDLP
ncbi:MAG: right-handed parallel beta-helix repeat-containing protein [Kiritimatiellales bacterium]